MQNYKKQSSDAKVVEPTVTPVLAESQMSKNVLIHPISRLTQSRLYHGQQPHQLGNCLATCVGCLMNLDNAEEVFQMQEHYHLDDPKDRGNWFFQLVRWLQDEGYDWHILSDHLYDGRYYMVFGESPCGRLHACIYQNGKLVHDPHPDGGGLVSETDFHTLNWID